MIKPMKMKPKLKIPTISLNSKSIRFKTLQLESRNKFYRFQLMDVDCFPLRDYAYNVLPDFIFKEISVFQ